MAAYTTVYKFSFVLAFMDATLAAILAAKGDIHFVLFAILSGLMLVHGLYYRAMVDEKGE